MSFKSRSFDPARDSTWYSRVWEARGFDPPPMPKVNLVLEDENTGRPVAAGGLVLTDSDFTLPDGFCTDPEAPKEIRKLALQNLFTWAGETSVKLGYGRGIIMTSASTILDHGIILEDDSSGKFKVEPFLGHKVFVISFKGTKTNGQ